MKWSSLMSHRTESRLPRSYCAYEVYDTIGEHVVPEDYADQYRCDESIPIVGNHLELVKPASTQSRSYSNTRDHILELSDPFSGTEIELLTGQAELHDCWLDGEHCGFQFSKGRVVPLNADMFVGDLVLMNQTDQTKTPTDKPAMLFATNDTPPYSVAETQERKAESPNLRRRN